MAKVLFKRRTTAEIDELEVEDGSLVYNTDNGKTYMDFGEERIQTGGNADTIISTETTEPTDEDIKLWINPDKVTPTGASNVVNSMSGTQTDKSPSVNAVKEYVNEKSNDILNGTVLYESTNGTTGTVTLSESVANYDYIDIHFKTNDGNFIKMERLYKPNGKATSLMYWHLSSNTFGYVKVRSININGTSITNSNYSEFSISTSVSASASNNIYITRVVGYK